MAKTVGKWLEDIERREKAIKENWRDSADKIVQIYEADKDEKVPFNILYSNTETLLPALYNSTPRPEITRRFTTFGPEKALDVALQNTGERVLEYTADSNVLEYQTYDEATRDAVLSGLVPGQGICRVRYHAEEEGGFQEICFEAVPYDRFVWAFARKWQDVPWVAFAYDLIKQDFEDQFPEFCKTKEYKDYKWEEDNSEEESPEDQDRRKEAGTEKRASVRVWEIWDAHAKMIYFAGTPFKKGFVKEEPYPFDLTSRFPMPKPLQFVKRVDNLMPVPPYQLYESQARELNELTNRLKLVIKAIKVRGAYNGQMTEIANILKADDTELIPVENASIMGETGGFDKHIWLMPLAELISVAKELYASREQVKSTIYEIMGIGDILRGASVASETAKAQEIKNQWGSLRVKRMQRDVQTFCRDLFRIAFEFISNLYTPTTLQQITKLPYLSMQQKQMFGQQMQQAQIQAQQTGQPPQIPQEMQVLMSAPSWDDISAKLRDQYERTYRIDVETNSTVDLEATEDKAQIAEFMNAWGQMMSGITPLVENGAMPFEAAKVVMGEVFRRFRFARRVEQALDMIQQPQPKEDPKAIKEKHDAEMAKVQAEAKRQVGEMQESLIEYTGEIERLRVENTKLKAGQDLLSASSDLDRKGMEIQGRMTEHQLRTDYQGKINLQKQQMAGKQIQMDNEQAQGDLEGMLQQHQQEVGNMITKALQQMQTQQQEAQMAERESAGSEAETPEKEGDSELKAAIMALVKGQEQLAASVQKLTELTAAERETEVIVGKDGKKKGRSRLVLQ